MRQQALIIRTKSYILKERIHDKIVILLVKRKYILIKL